MTQALRSDQVLDEFDRPVPGASIYVYVNDTDAEASLTSDGTTPLTQPVTTDEFGVYTYWAEENFYREEIWFGGKLRWKEIGAIGSPGADLALRGDLAATTGATIVKTSTGTTVQDELDKIGTKDEGTLPASAAYTPFQISKTAAGNASGTSDWRALIETGTFTGAFGATQINGNNVQHNLVHTAGTVASAIWLQGYLALGVPSTITTTGGISSAKGIEFHISHTGSSAISSAHVFSAMGPDLDVGSGTMDKFHNYHSDDISGGGVTTRITTETYGFFQANCTANGAPIMAAYGCELSGGTGRWGLLFTGGANNALAGRLRLGDTTAPGDALEVKGFAKLTQDGTISSTGLYHELVSGNNDYVARVRSVHASTPNGLRISFTAAAPNNQSQTFLLCEDSGGTKAALYSDGTLFHRGSVSANGGVGYTGGAGGAVAQITSKATGVTLNKACGQITLNNAALAASTSVSFTLTNSIIAATDVVNVCIGSGATAASYVVGVDAVAAGSCRIHIRNVSAGSLSEALILNFAVIKAASS